MGGSCHPKQDLEQGRHFSKTRGFVSSVLQAVSRRGLGRRRPGTQPSEQKEGAPRSPDPEPGCSWARSLAPLFLCWHHRIRGQVLGTTVALFCDAYPQFLPSRPPADCPQVWGLTSFSSCVQHVDIGLFSPCIQAWLCAGRSGEAARRGPMPGQAAGGPSCRCRSELGPHNRACGRLAAKHRGLGDAVSAGFGKDGEAPDTGTQHSRATVLPQNRWSHTKQQIRNFLFYFYCKICTGRGHVAWESFLLLSLLAAHERQPSPEWDPRGPRRPPSRWRGIHREALHRLVPLLRSTTAKPAEALCRAEAFEDN